MCACLCGMWAYAFECDCLQKRVSYAPRAGRTSVCLPSNTGTRLWSSSSPVLDHVNSIRYGFHLIEQTLNPSFKKRLEIPLSYAIAWAYLASRKLQLTVGSLRLDSPAGILLSCCLKDISMKWLLVTYDSGIYEERGWGGVCKRQRWEWF